MGPKFIILQIGGKTCKEELRRIDVVAVVVVVFVVVVVLVVVVIFVLVVVRSLPLKFGQNRFSNS